MSFDVYIGDWSDNYTANMGAFFAWALQGVDTPEPEKRSDSRDAVFGKRPSDGLVMLDGMTTEAVAMKLRKALARVDAADADWLQRFNAPNGWGRVDRATAFLEGILQACEEKPGDVVRVSM